MLKQKEWIEVIVAKTGCTKKEAKMFYDCVFDYIKEQISEDEPIKIQGLGVFKLRKTAAKEQVNLITGQLEVVPEHGVVTFKPYFEIDPKPEAIEVEDEEVVVEEVPVEEAVVEEAPVEEAPVEEVPVEETPVEEAPVEEVQVEDDGYVWVIAGENRTTAEVVAFLGEKTDLSDDEIMGAVDVVKTNMQTAETNTCEIRETETTFDFVILKK